MAEAATIEAPAAHAAHHTTTGLSHNKIGMWLFLASDCLLFGALISTYLLYHDRISALELGPKAVFDIPFTSVSSFVLLMSSLTMVLALSALQRGDIARNRLWLVVTAMLGATVRRRAGLRVHRLLPRGLGLHDQPVRLGLLHDDRVPRRPRHRSAS
jgi:heme/copper-type cytochrome/quinol oxidase subunit 3